MTHAEVLLAVKRLYALARANGSEHEAKAATLAAERLIQKHRLSMAEIETAETGREPVTQEAPDRPVGLWRNALAGALMKRYSCSGVVSGSKLHVFGTASDLAIWRLQYDRIGDLVTYLSSRAAAGRGRSWLNAYRVGMVAAIIQRLVAESATEPATEAIVRLDQKSEASTEAAAQAFPNAITVRPRKRRFDGQAWRAGEEQGKQVHLGESMGPAVRGALPGGSS